MNLSIIPFLPCGPSRSSLPSSTRCSTRASSPWTDTNPCSPRPSSPSIEAAPIDHVAADIAEGTDVDVIHDHFLPETADNPVQPDGDGAADPVKEEELALKDLLEAKKTPLSPPGALGARRRSTGLKGLLTGIFNKNKSREEDDSIVLGSLFDDEDTDTTIKLGGYLLTHVALYVPHRS